MRKLILTILAVVMFSSNSFSAERNESSCKFSHLLIWSKLHTWLWEVDRIRKELITLREARQMDAQELYWAQQDINKQAFLPSETVRAAYETASYFGKSVASYDAQINSQEWCLQCAIKRNNGVDVCD